MQDMPGDRLQPSAYQELWRMEQSNLQTQKSKELLYQQDYAAAIEADGMRSIHFGADYAIMHTEVRRTDPLARAAGTLARAGKARSMVKSGEKGVEYTHVLVELAEDGAQQEHLVWE